MNFPDFFPGKISENDTWSLFKQILSAVNYCHNAGIIHRGNFLRNFHHLSLTCHIWHPPVKIWRVTDLKHNNIMINKEGAIKLIDFGTSNFLSDGKLAETFCGTPRYAAPEMVNFHRNFAEHSKKIPGKSGEISSYVLTRCRCWDRNTTVHWLIRGVLVLFSTWCWPRNFPLRWDASSIPSTAHFFLFTFSRTFILNLQYLFENFRLKLRLYVYNAIVDWPPTRRWPTCSSVSTRSRREFPRNVSSSWEECWWSNLRKDRTFQNWCLIDGSPNRLNRCSI